MTRRQLRKLFKKHHGSMKRVADRVGVSTESVSRYLKGESKSARIEPAVLQEAKHLALQEALNDEMRQDLAVVRGKQQTAV